MKEDQLIKKNPNKLIDQLEFKEHPKELIKKYFNLLLTGSPRIQFSVINKKGKIIADRVLNIEIG